MKIKRKLTIASILIALATGSTIVVIRSTETVHAQDQTPPPTNDRILYAMSGLPTGHTMRVYVTSLTPPPTPDLPPGPVRVVFNFRNAAGNLVRDNRSGEVIRRIVMIESGESAFFDLDADALPPGPIRYQVRPVITVQYPSGALPPPVPDRIVTSVEIFNNSNPRALIVIGGNPAVIRGFNPQSDPPIE